MNTRWIFFCRTFASCYIQLLARLSKGTQRVSDPPPNMSTVSRRERERDSDLDCFSLFFFFVYCVYFVNYTTSN